MDEYAEKACNLHWYFQHLFSVKKSRLFFYLGKQRFTSFCFSLKLKYFKAVAGRELTPGIIAVIQSFGSRINLHPHLHFLVCEGGSDREGRFHSISRFNDDLLREIFTREVFSLLLRKKLIGLSLVQKILRWRHTGFSVHSQVRAASKREAETQLSHPPIIEDDPTYVPSKGWAEMVRKVYEADPLRCPSCGGQMRIISFIEEPKIVDRIIAHLELTFEAERPPPPHNLQQQLLMAAEEKGEYF